MNKNMTKKQPPPQTESKFEKENPVMNQNSSSFLKLTFSIFFTKSPSAFNNAAQGCSSRDELYQQLHICYWHHSFQWPRWHNRGLTCMQGRKTTQLKNRTWSNVRVCFICMCVYLLDSCSYRETHMLYLLKTYLFLSDCPRCFFPLGSIATDFFFMK